jgi:hypothetical protein
MAQPWMFMMMMMMMMMMKSQSNCSFTVGCQFEGYVVGEWPNTLIFSFVELVKVKSTLV